MVDELYWDALFPAAWKQSDIVFRKQFEIPSEIESGEHLAPESISNFSLFVTIALLYIRREAGNFEIPPKFRRMGFRL